MNEQPKKTRALPRQWKRFLYLEIGDQFFVGRCRYVKAGFFHAAAVPSTRTIRVWPWTRVQSDVLVRDALPGGKSSVVAEMDAARERVDAVVNDGITHYVGDNCPGGHTEDLPRVEQPASDNSVTGPTS